MTLAKFACSLRGEPRNEVARKVRLTRVAESHAKAAEHAHLDPVPVHETIPSKPTCFLQLWEADHFAAHYMIIGETAQPTRANRLVGSIPGAVVKNGSRYLFVSMGGAENTHDFDRLKGHVTVEVESDSGAPRHMFLPLPEYEGVVELVGAIKAGSNDASLASFRHGKPHQVHNVGATVLRQMRDRGGLHMSFVADYDFATANSNNKEFRRQADALVPHMPSIAVIDGKVGFGRYETPEGTQSMAKQMAETRAAVKAEFEFDGEPPIASMGIFAHGVVRGVNMGKGYSDKNSIDLSNVEGFVTSVRKHLSQNVVIALFSCNTARGGGMTGTTVTERNRHKALRSKKEALAIFGRRFIGEELGGDSFAWELTQQLIRQGIRFPTVWGHTIAAHTTRNRRTRVFSAFGSADLTSLLFETHRVDKATRKAYIARTQKPHSERQNFIRNIHFLSAHYLPWAWEGGEEANDSTPGFSEDARADARALLSAFKGELVSDGPIGTAEELDVELDGSQRYIVGPRKAGKNPQLSPNFFLSDFSAHAGGVPVPLDLVRKLQMLRCRSGVSMTIAGVVARSDGEGVQGLHVQVDAGKRDAVVTAAQKMVDEKLCFTSVTPVGVDSLTILGPAIAAPT
jgi:hypothetical protein